MAVMDKKAANVAIEAQQEARAAMAGSVRGSHLVRDAEKPAGVIGTIGKLWNLVGVAAMIALPVGGVARFVGGKVGAGVAKTALTKVTQVSELATSVTAQDAAAHVGQIFGEKSAITKGVHGVSKKVAEHGQKIAGHSSWAKNAVDNIKGNSLAGTLFTGAMVVQSGYGIVAAKYDKAKVLQQMQYDLTGEKVSKSAALTSGKLDPLVLKARKEATGKKAWLADAADVAGMAGNLFLMTKSDGGGGRGAMMTGLKSAAITFIPGMVSKTLRSQDTALEAYQAMYVSIAKTGEADVSLYEAVIGGLNKGASSRLVSEVARKAHDNHFTPAQVMKMCAETNFMDPGSSFAARLDAGRKARGGAAMAATA